VLREHEAGAAVAELCRKHGMSSATCYASKVMCGGMGVPGAKRLKALKEENVKLNRLYADAMLDNAGLKELLAKKVTPACRRDAVAHLTASLEVSERRACTMIAADRSVVRYRSRRPDDVGRVRLCPNTVKR
jgi:putative transposase